MEKPKSLRITVHLQNSLKLKSLLKISQIPLKKGNYQNPFPFNFSFFQFETLENLEIPEWETR